MTSRTEGRSAPWRMIGLCVALGVGARATLFALAQPLDIQSDEANYLYLALVLEHFDLYLDQHRYLWPPAYPWLLSLATGAFGIPGLDIVRGFQVALSGVVGATTMLFAWRLFSRRAALVAGLLWAFHVPLAAYTHFLWTEPLFLALFLPALWFLLLGLEAEECEAEEVETEDGHRVTWPYLVSGLLFGAAIYVKTLPLILLPLAALLVFARSRQKGTVEALRRASLVPLMALVVALPWTLRNLEVYGRMVIGGSTLGENAFIGLNTRYMNFDLIPLHKPRTLQKLTPLDELRRGWFTAGPENQHPKSGGWHRAETIVHAIDRQGVQLREGVAYALSHPGWALRTRAKKWSDLVTPLSFFTRHQALEKYPETSALAGALRIPLVLWSLVFPVGLMLAATAGYFGTLARGPGRDLVTLLLTYILATSLIVSMSRFRVPAEPFLVILAAGFLAHGRTTTSTLRVAGFAAVLLVLVGLWWISFPETIAVARMALGAAE